MFQGFFGVAEDSGGGIYFYRYTNKVLILGKKNKRKFFPFFPILFVYHCVVDVGLGWGLVKILTNWLETFLFLFRII
jgi:hypothetical protein